MLFPFSVLFSGSESAFMSISKKEIESLSKSENNNERKVSKLLSENTDQLLITFLLGNNLVNVSIATVAAIITDTLCRTFFIPEPWIYIIDVVAVGTMILLIGEILPKSYAISNNIKFATKVLRFIMFFYAIFYPLSYIINGSLRILNGKNQLSKISDSLSIKDIGSFMHKEEDSELEDDERQMINQIVEFGKKNAKDIMVPRVDMKAMEDDVNLSDIIAFFNEHGFSRIPVYHENIDNIIGILYIKDLLSYLDLKEEEIDLKKILREVNFIPESKDIGDLLKMFQKEKIHIAIVVDEYGGTSGMITLEDIIEEIVGEIQDEFDDDEKLCKRSEDGLFEFDAKIPLEDVNKILDVVLPLDEDFESLGGFLYYIFGEVPEIGDKKTYKNLTFTILTLEKQRIGWVKVKVNDKEFTNEN
ncbi:MAG: HlyC/CorC family transporter [Candidatus Delongbacteria bacterium]|nr:HlyC/CorC family transporter [Candidatus Delongbacteria bacterium]MBN2836254.1 HlyC/CorC family transporter [Candidatus Delongbacteria bacterium]